jgi:hypothetical protein
MMTLAFYLHHTRTPVAMLLPLKTLQSVYVIKWYASKCRACKLCQIRQPAMYMTSAKIHS